jgi:hypothetical protein
MENKVKLIKKSFPSVFGLSTVRYLFLQWYSSTRFAGSWRGTSMRGLLDHPLARTWRATGTAASSINAADIKSLLRSSTTVQPIYCTATQSPLCDGLLRRYLRARRTSLEICSPNEPVIASCLLRAWPSAMVPTFKEPCLLPCKHICTWLSASDNSTSTIPHHVAKSLVTTPGPVECIIAPRQLCRVTTEDSDRPETIVIVSKALLT